MEKDAQSRASAHWGRREKTKQASVNPPPHQPLGCQTHSDEILKFYCETCSALICRDCIVIDHTGHDYNRVENIAEKESASLQSSLLSVSGAKSKLSDALALGDKMMQQVQAKQKSVEEDIKRSLMKYARLFAIARKFFWPELLRLVLESWQL